MALALTLINLKWASYFTFNIIVSILWKGNHMTALDMQNINKQIFHDGN